VFNLGFDLKEYMQGIERIMISDALQKTRHNKTAAAKILGISFRALRYRIEQLNIGD
jgi:two-component system response regulator PilR (NtrC family)